MRLEPGTGLGIGARATVALLSAVCLVAWLQRVSGGLVLASSWLGVAVFAVGLVAVFAVARWMRPFEPPDSPGAWGAALAFLAALQVLATYWGSEVDIGGDYRMHRMYSYQLLNGFAQSHEPYRGVAGHYPPLVHTTVALVARATGLTVHYAMLVVSLAVSIGVALEGVRVARLAGASPLAARFFAGLLVGWGGTWWVELREAQLFLPAIQLGLPFLSRNLALLLVLILAGIVLRFEASRRGEPGTGFGRGDALAAGLVVGLLGLTRPWEFAAAAAGVAALAAVRRSPGLAASLLLAFGLASLFWLPLAIDWLELGIRAEREVARSEDWPTSLSTYGLLLPLIALALGRWRSMPQPVTACAFGLALAALATFGAAGLSATGLEAAFGLEGGLFKLERAGQLVALCVYGLAAFGLQSLAERVGRATAATLACALIVLGSVTTLRANGTFLDGAPQWLPERWLRAPAYVSDLAGSPFYLRHLLADRTVVVLAPAAMGHLTASRNGVDVVWSHQAAPIWADRGAGDLSVATRRRELDRFYAQLARGVVDGRLALELGARHFVAASREPAVLPEVRSLGPIGSFAGESWYLLEIRAEDPGAVASGSDGA